MKLMQTIVAGAGFRDVAHNPTRLGMLDVLLAVARYKGADLLMLPAGYFAANTLTDRAARIADVARRADSAAVSVAFGVDLPEAPEGKTAAAPVLPYSGAVRGPVTGGPWQQTSSTGQNAASVPAASVPGANHVVTDAGCRVGVLICGELFSAPARASFANLGLGLAIDLGHYGMGTGVTRAMQNIAANGTCAVAHTHHLARWNGQSLHYAHPGGNRDSVSIDVCEWVGDDDFWAAWCVRDM
jgi:hypothetical protein